ncbi:MAG: hypothetical protein JO345_01370 [Streptosporangiaceae bacterium]|nr:hypothetical protein [Streptosporangiaceae bacterium]
MSVKYTLTLVNESTQPRLNFDVYAAIPVTTEQSDGDSKIVNSYRDVYPLAWLSALTSQSQSQYRFSWTLEYSFLYAEQGCQAGSLWSPNSVAVDVNPNNKSTNTAYLDYSQGAYSLCLMDAGSGNPVDSSKVYLVTSPSVPSWSQKSGPSVGLAITAAVDGQTSNPVPATVTDSGPNLLHTFNLKCTYRVHLSSDEQATMTDWDAVQNYQPVDFGSGYAETCTLQSSNTWQCEAST